MWGIPEARSGAAAQSPPPTLPLRRHPSCWPGPPGPIDKIHCGSSPGQLMGSQSSKAPRGDVTGEEAAGASPPPPQVSGPEDGHVKSHADSPPKGEGSRPL